MTMADPSRPRRDASARRPRFAPKGRALDHEALAEIRALLAGEEPSRERLIEYLHLIQDRYGALQARHLKALAEAMRLSEAEIFEVASFYHHFDIVKDGEAVPAPLTIRVCDSLSCMMAGAEAVIAGLQGAIDPARIRVLRAPCIGRCAEAPAAMVGRNGLGHVDAAGLAEMAGRDERNPILPRAIRLGAYRAAGGYRLHFACRAGERSPDELIALLSDAGLRGLGGAGFPAGKKWQSVRSFPGPRLMTINADEGEPGTFKDRYWLERDPHRMLEGALVAAWAVQAERIYLYLRDEYPHLHVLLEEEIAALEAAAICPPGLIVLRRGAGAYICGEESAMIESLEGKRGLPRHRPPFIAERGLFGRPTLNHNVETLFWLRDIVERGPGWFADQGLRGAKGFRSWSVSGRVARPGVVVAPAGSTANELIALAGGMAPGHRLAGYLPGGASGGVLPATLAEEPLDFGTLDKHGCFIGSHAVVILSDQDDLRAVAQNLLAFFAHESCGQCTPCRAGTEKMHRLLKAPRWDKTLLGDLDQVMRDASICGLGQAAPNPVRSILRFFPEVAG